MRFNPFSRVPATRAGRYAGAAIAGVGLAAAINALVATRTERRHRPRGSFIDVSGVRLHYTDRGAGPTVVLIHGNVVSSEDWETSGVTDLLLPGHRVILIDRPGFGHSERPRQGLWTASKQADLLHQALRQLGVERPIVVGHSWGAIVALAMAIRHPAYVAGLVVVSGYYYWTARPDVPLVTMGALPILGDLLRYTVSPLLGWLQMPILKRLMFSPLKVPERFDGEYSTGMALRPSQIRATAEDGALMIPAALALEDHYEELTMPVVIIVGAEDKVVFARGAQRLARCIGGSVLQTVGGAGHMVHYVAPEKVAYAVAHLAGLEAPVAVAA